MKKDFIKNIIIGLAIFIVIILAFLAFDNIRAIIETKIEENKDYGPLLYESTEDMKSTLDSVYEISKNSIYQLETKVLDLSDLDSLKFYTGLDSNENLTEIIVSETDMVPMAYSVLLVKVDENSDAEVIEQKIADNINADRWPDASSVIVYSTNYKNLIFIAVSTEDVAMQQVNAFKRLAKDNIGMLYYREIKTIQTEDKEQ